MGLIMEVAEELIRKSMEDPKEREGRRREHVYAVKERCRKRVEESKLPFRPYGFWTFERQNLCLAWDMQLTNAPGRADPYHSIPTDPFHSLSLK